MNFTEVVTEVMSIVKRPDKLLDAQREVNAAVNLFCSDVSPGFSFDIVEVSPPLVADQLTQALPLSTFPRLRKFQYIKRGGTRCFLSVLPRKELLNGGACDFSDKYYLAGSNVNFSLKAFAQSLDVAYFQSPPKLTDAAPTFWMLELSPYMVIDQAAAKIFNDIGDNDSYNKRLASARISFLAAQKDYGIATQ